MTGMKGRSFMYFNWFLAMLMAKVIEAKVEKDNIILCIYTHRIVKLCLEEY